MNARENGMPEQTPILVWTMGKVGTTTISHALKKAGIPTLHMHSIRPQVHSAVRKTRWKTALRQYWDKQIFFRRTDKTSDRGRRARGPIKSLQREWSAVTKALMPPVVPHIEASQKAIDLIENGAAPIKIITMVREPIARNISAFFQNLEGFSVSYDDPTEELVGTFKSRYPHHVPLRWFDQEIKDGVGFDVFAHPFDHEARLARYSQGRFDFLIMRVDADIERQQEEVSKFVERPLSLVVANSAEAKPYAEAYGAFKDQLLLDQQYVEKMYNSKFAKHFWTGEELDQMAHRVATR